MTRRFTTVTTRAPIARAAAVAPVLLSGCGSHSASSRSTSTATSGTEGSGVLATQHRRVADFTRVDLAGTSKVIVRVGAPKSVVVHGDDNLLPLITTKVSDGTLVVAESGSFDSQRGVEVDVTIPSVSGVALSGTGDLTATGVRADRLRSILSAPACSR